MAKVPDFSLSSNSRYVLVSKAKTYTVELDSAAKALPSPDGRHLAVGSRADAVRGARVEIIDVLTGKQEQAFDLDSTTAEPLSWAPDGSAVVVLHAGGQPPNASSALTVYRRDGSKADAAVNEPVSRGGVLQNPHWVEAGGRMTYGAACTVAGKPSAPCIQTQLTTSKAQAVLLATDQSVFGRWDSSSQSIVKLDDDPNTSVIACGRYGILTNRQGQSIYDADAETLTAISGKVGTCPVPSPSGTSVAFSTTSGPVAVDLVAGTTVPIAREGTPVAWSADERSVLVVAVSGSFVVAADGSGGKESSEKMSAACAGGVAGAVLARGASQIFSFDIGSDSATTFDGANFSGGSSCQVAADGSWTYFSGVLYDLRKGKAGALSVPLASGRTATGSFAWRVPARVGPPIRS